MFLCNMFLIYPCFFRDEIQIFKQIITAFLKNTLLTRPVNPLDYPKGKKKPLDGRLTHAVLQHKLKKVCIRTWHLGQNRLPLW